MGTSLVNSKMSPELRARIEASVRRSSRTAKPGLPLFVKTALRLSLVIVVLGGSGWLLLGWRAHLREVDGARSALLAEVRESVAALGGADTELRAAAQALLLTASTKYEGDHVAPTLETPAGIDALLARPTVYVRGPIDAPRTSSDFERALQETVDDSFVQCLVAPPTARTESVLLQAIEAPRDVALRFLLAEAFTARPFANDAWTSEVLAATTLADVRTLRKGVDQAHIERAVLAAHAEVLIYVLDEPRTAGTFAELDGASDHHIRIGIVDLTSDNTVLRLRRHVEPSWVSEANRHYFARGLVMCRLALDVRKALGDGGGP